MSDYLNSRLSSLSKRLIYSAFAVLLLIILAAISIAYSQISSNLQRIDKLVSAQHTKINLATTIVSGIQQQETLMRIQHIQDAARRDQLVSEFIRQSSENRQARQQLAGLLTGNTEKEMFDNIIELASQTSLNHHRLIELFNDGGFETAQDILIEQSLPLHDALLKQTGEFLKHEQDMSARVISQARNKFNHTLGLLVLMLGLATCTCIYIAITVVQRVKRADNLLFAQATLESIGDAVITTDAHGKIIYTNGKALSLLDTKSYNVIGKHLADMLKHHDQRLIADIRHAAQHGIPYSCLFGETRLMPSGDTVKSVEYRVSPIHNKHKIIQGTVLAFHDISERELIKDELYKSQERLSLVMKGTHDGIWDYSLVTGEIYFSPRWKEMLGYKEEEFTDSFTAWQEHIHPRDLGSILLNWTDCMNGISDSFQVEYRMRPKNGDWIWIECRGMAQLDESNKPVRLAGSHTDITIRKKVEQALFEAKEHAEVTLQSIGDAVITLDRNGNVDYLNNVAETLSGWPSNQANGKAFDKVIKLYEEDGGDPIELCSAVDQQQEAGPAQVTNAILVSRDNREHCVEHTFSPIKTRTNKTAGVVIVLRDVSTERTLKKQLYWQANHDSLTGLVNRSSFENRLAEAIESARVYHQEYALLYMDLDQFKVVNDTCGHLAGDELLRQLAKLLKNTLRAADTLARLGGDEFGILLDRCPLNDAVSIAQSLKESVRNYRFGWENKTFEIGACIGVVPVTATSACKEHLLSAADVACYTAKDLGRNRVHIYEGTENDLSKNHGEMHWVTRISEALQEDKFVLYKQAITSIGDGVNEVHHEILIRMLGDDGALIPPGAFIPAAERYNLMPSIDRWVIRALFELYSTADQYTVVGNTSSKHEIFTINLSGNSINDTDFLTFVSEQIQHFNLPASSFCFEITETSAIANLSTATDFIHELKQLGCLFALDDFGSGLSSFGYLKNLPVDFLKIDGQFVKGIVDDPIDAEMVRSINEIGHVMGMRTIAEFVEDKAILGKLKEIGVDFAQGYEIAKPEPFVETEEIIKKTAS